MWKPVINNQRGQAITELSLMMLFLAVVLLGMIFIAVYLSQNVSAAEKVRYEMRLSMYRNAQGPFKENTKEIGVQVDLPGLMKRIFKTPFLESRHKIEFYEGAYTGRGNSYYTQRELYRKIEP